MLDATGVLMLAGSFFGLPSDHLSARLAFVDFDGGAALEAIATLELKGATVGSDAAARRFVETVCPNVADGVRRMTDWARSSVIQDRRRQFR